MIFLRQEQSMSSPSVNYESDATNDERPTSSPTQSHILAKFQIARPPPKSSLRLAPKLLFQIQQLAPNQRPVPVLEIWQPPFRKSKLTQDFHHKPKLRSRDIYVTLDEPYIIASQRARKQLTESDLQEKNGCSVPNRNIVAAMCQPEARQSIQSTIHFRDARHSWQASAGFTGSGQSTPCYRFILTDDKKDGSDPGRMIMQWEKRPIARRNLNDTLPSDAEHFVLVIIDRKARRKCRIATMTPGGLEIAIRKSSVMEQLQVCWDLTEPGGVSPEHNCENLEMWLYTQVLVFGAWVAYQEGWLN